MWARMFGCGLLMAAGLAAAAQHARADVVPGIGRLPFYHFSLDRTPVTVAFVLRSGRRDFPQLTIARAYIYFANNHTNKSYSSKVGPLPPLVETDHLGVAFTEPDGEPWSIAVDAHARTRGIDRESAASVLRVQQYSVKLTPNLNATFADTLRQSTRTSLVQQPSSYEGREHYKTAGTGSVFIGTPEDEFILARCYDPPHPQKFCSYVWRITDDIIAEGTSPDLRLNGGREYANRRLQFARRIICRFLEQC